MEPEYLFISTQRGLVDDRLDLYWESKQRYRNLYTSSQDLTLRFPVSQESLFAE